MLKEVENFFLLMHLIDLQENFLDIIEDNAKSGLKESIRVDIDGKTYNLTPDDDQGYFDRGIRLVSKASGLELNLSDDTTISVRVAKSSVQPTHAVNCIDVGDDGKLVVTGDCDGKVICYRKRPVMEVKEAHLADVLQVCVFPSWKVVLSMGLDYQLKLWSVPDGKCARTFSGVQKKRLTGISLIGRGRNFVSGSMDGTVRMWECGSGSCTDTFQRPKKLDDAVLSLCVDQYDPPILDQEPYYECTGKRLYVGHASGVVSIWNLGTRTLIGEIDTESGSFGGIKSIAVMDDLMIVGYEHRAVVKCYRLTVLQQITREIVWQTWVGHSGEELEVKSLQPHGDRVICLASNMLVSIMADEGTLLEYYATVGKVNDIKVSGQHLYSCGERLTTY